MELLVAVNLLNMYFEDAEEVLEKLFNLQNNIYELTTQNAGHVNADLLQDLRSKAPFMATCIETFAVSWLVLPLTTFVMSGFLAKPI